MDKYTHFLGSPASEWELASPVGNGYSGAMIFGGVACEHIQLTEERIWSGEKLQTGREGFRDHLNEVRRLLMEGKGAEADEYANTKFVGAFTRIKSHESAGDLFVLFDGDDSCTDYRREIDMLHGVSRVSFKKGGAEYVREAFASYPDRVIAMRHTGAHSATVFYRRPFGKLRALPNTEQILADPADVGIKSVECVGDTMTVRGETSDDKHDFCVKIRIVTDGTLRADGSRFRIENASCTEYYIVMAAEAEPMLPADGYDILRGRSTEDFSAIMGRSEIELGDGSTDALPVDALPVDARLARLREDENASDASLAALYFRFGKYLLISSSRPGTLPANLQGVWNGYIEAPWNADYHTNINLQMNYWHAESANISECATALFDYMNDYLLESGRETARVNYRCRGTVLHHLSDIYGMTAAADGVWGLWPLGGAWLCYAMWEHYLYTGDEQFLRDTAYEYIRDCARFFLDYMIEDDKGRLISGPSTSPENRYYQNGNKVYLCMSPTMDVEVIGGLLRFYVETEEILGICPEWADEARAALTKMPPLQIGKHGQIMEWMEDYDEPEPGHRHISHMFALYPDCAISTDTPDLFAASKKTLERRLSNGGGHSGWSCAWLIALYARLGDAEGVATTIRKLLTKSTRESLLDNHPPFQIDGNFGGTAAIIESLMQSHNGKLVLLPACPEEFATGSFRRLCARGGAEVSAKWSGGVVTEVTITAVRGDYQTELRVNGKSYDIKLKKGESVTL